MAAIEALLEIMAKLRDPDGGCPWDLEQDFSTISPHTIEEAYEVDEAIATGDLEALRDELGDLLFQVVFQARIAEEQGAFDFASVTEAIISKLVRRHPHVFASAEAPATKEAQTASWEAIKAAEREASGRAKGNGPPDPFAGIPRHLPALARSAKVAGRIARMAPGAVPASEPGSHPVRLEGIRAALARTQRDADARLSSSDAAPPPTDPEAARDRSTSRDDARLVAEGLQAWVRLARSLGVDPEQALRQLDDETMSIARRDVHQAGRSGHR